MSHGDISFRAVTNPHKPGAFAVCDGCGGWYNRVSLRYQFEWAGDALINQRFLYCYRCISKPQPQLKTIILPLDPVPVMDPRVETFARDQNLNGFRQSVGPQGTTVTHGAGGFPATFGEVILTELNPAEPFRTKAEVLSSALTGWGLPMPVLVDRSTTITTASVGQKILDANPNRTYLLFYGPQSLFYAVAQDAAPVLTIPTSVFIGQALYAPTVPQDTLTVTAGTGGAILQNAGATPPGNVWLGEVWALGFITGQAIWCWENTSCD